MKALGKYMYVRSPLPSKTGKTSIWRIVDRGNGTLGIIKWFGRWRCYAFFPETNTVFNADCMSELVKFCEGETKNQKGN